MTPTPEVWPHPKPEGEMGQKETSLCFYHDVSSSKLPRYHRVVDCDVITLKNLVNVPFRNRRFCVSVSLDLMLVEPTSDSVDTPWNDIPAVSTPTARRFSANDLTSESFDIVHRERAWRLVHA